MITATRELSQGRLHGTRQVGLHGAHQVRRHGSHQVLLHGTHQVETYNGETRQLPSTWDTPSWTPAEGQENARPTAKCISRPCSRYDPRPGHDNAPEGATGCSKIESRQEWILRGMMGKEKAERWPEHKQWYCSKYGKGHDTQ